MKWWLYLLPIIFCLPAALSVTAVNCFDNYLWKKEAKMSSWGVFLHAFFLFGILLYLMLSVDLYFIIKLEYPGLVFITITAVLTTIHKYIICKKFPIEKKEEKTKN
jgi:hypothetical protein